MASFLTAGRCSCLHAHCSPPTCGPHTLASIFPTVCFFLSAGSVSLMYTHATLLDRCPCTSLVLNLCYSMISARLASTSCSVPSSSSISLLLLEVICGPQLQGVLDRGLETLAGGADGKTLPGTRAIISQDPEATQGNLNSEFTAVQRLGHTGQEAFGNVPVQLTTGSADHGGLTITGQDPRPISPAGI